MTATVLLVLAGLLAVGLLVQAAARCRREIREERARVRRRAEVADVFGQVGRLWDRRTEVLAEGLAPLLAQHDDPARRLAGQIVTGFGDSMVAEEQLRRAFQQMDLVEENRQ